MKRHPIEWNKIFADNVSVKDLMSRIYTELYFNNGEKVQFKSGQEQPQGKHLAVPQNVNHRVTIQPAIPLLSIYLREVKMHFHTNLYTLPGEGESQGR